MEETKKREGHAAGGGGVEMKRRHSDSSGSVDVGGGEDIVESWLMDDEDDTLSAVMNFLDTDPEAESTAAESTARVKFIADPYASPLIFQCSNSYITINGNEESCGSSFSDWESSVMASVDVGGRLKVDAGELGEWVGLGGRVEVEGENYGSA